VTPLFSYQEAGATWLASKRFAYLADEMRVGKTPQVVVACDTLRPARTLVVCPAVARLDWSRKFREFSDLDRVIQIVTNRKDTIGCDSQVVITSYDLYDAARFRGPWDLVVCDEAHYLKSCTAARTKAILGQDGLIHNTKRMWLLSGTPAPNNYSELWPMLHVFGLYKGNYESFVREYCTGYHSPYGYQITGSKNPESLKAIMAPIMLRRKLADVAPDLPPVVFEDYTIDGLVFSDKVVLQQAEEAIDKLRAAKTTDQQLAILDAYIPQLATLRRFIGIAKVKATVDLIHSELEDNRDQLVVFAYHREVVAELQRQIQVPTVSIVGGTNPADRDSAIRKFQNGNARVFIGQLQAAGTAIDLSAADQCLFIESSWTPGDNAQAVRRLVNVNKKRPVSARFLGLASSIDGAIQRAVARKTRDLVALFD